MVGSKTNLVSERGLWEGITQVERVEGKND
jgi:hypothetical protein